MQQNRNNGTSFLHNSYKSSLNIYLAISISGFKLVSIDSGNYVRGEKMT